MQLDGNTFLALLEEENEMRKLADEPLVTQAQIARHFGISAPSVSGWAKSQVPPRRIPELAEVFFANTQDELLARAKRISKPKTVHEIEDPIYLDELLCESFLGATIDDSMGNFDALGKVASDHNLPVSRIVSALAKNPDPQIRAISATLTPGEYVSSSLDTDRWRIFVREFLKDRNAENYLQLTAILATISDLVEYEEPRPSRSSFSLKELSDKSGVEVEKYWETILTLPLVERANNAEWVLYLKFPKADELEKN